MLFCCVFNFWSLYPSTWCSLQCSSCFDRGLSSQIRKLMHTNLAVEHKARTFLRMEHFQRSRGPDDVKSYFMDHGFLTTRSYVYKNEAGWSWISKSISWIWYLKCSLIWILCPRGGGVTATDWGCKRNLNIVFQIIWILYFIIIK